MEYMVTKWTKFIRDNYPIAKGHNFVSRKAISDLKIVLNNW